MPWTNALPPDTRAVGTGNPPIDMNAHTDALIAMGAGRNIQNPALAGGADPTGVADSTAAINAALAAGGDVYMGPGTFSVTGTLAMTVPGTRFYGATWGASTIKPTAGFTPDASGGIISVTGHHCEVAFHQILGGPNTTYTTNPAVSAGIEVGGTAQYASVHDISSYYINGWEVEVQASQTSFPLGGFLARIHGLLHNKGIHFKSTGAMAFNMQWQVTDIQHGQIAGDSLYIEDSQDVSVKGHNDSVTGSSGGSALHIKGFCSGLNLVNVDLGVYPLPGTAPVILIEDATRTITGTVSVAGTTTLTDSGGSFTTADIGRTVGTTNVPVSTVINSITNATTAVMSAAATGTSGPQNCTLSSSPSNDIEIGPGIAQSGSVGLQYNGGAVLVNFRGMTFSSHYTHGAVVAGTGIKFAGGSIFGGVTGDCVHFTDCTFNNNGLTGTQPYYDLNWTGNIPGAVRHCRFATSIVASGVGVTNSGNFTGTGNVAFDDNAMMALNTTASNAFATSPKYTRRNSIINPHGAVTITVPLTGVASASRGFDMVFYITAGASTCTCVVSGGVGGASVVIPSGGFGTVFVPAGSTLTPTYTAAPTWVVNGL